jgi:hypothetical protein
MILSARNTIENDKVDDDNDEEEEEEEGGGLGCMIYEGWIQDITESIHRLTPLLYCTEISMLYAQTKQLIHFHYLILLT